MVLHVRGWAAPGSVRGAFPHTWFCLNPQVGVQLSRAGRKCTTDVHQECTTDVHQKCTRHVHRKCTTYVRPKCTTHVHQNAPPCSEPAPATSKAGSEPGGRTRTMETPSPGRAPGDALLLMVFSMLVPTAPPVPAVCGSERGSCRRGGRSPRPGGGDDPDRPRPARDRGTGRAIPPGRGCWLT